MSSGQRRRQASDGAEEAAVSARLPQVSPHRGLLTGASVESAGDDRRQHRRHRRRGVGANLSATKFDIIYLAVERLGFSVCPDEDFVTPYLIWSDLGVPPDRISELRAHQRINHFPGMSEISRKDLLSRNMAKLARVLPKEYKFTPRTWCLPGEYSSFLQHSRELRKVGKLRSFIYKPANGAMGHGIRIYKNGEQVPCNGVSGGGNGGFDTTGPAIVQEYIAKPLLIDGFKCDLRIYVLVTSCDPLRVYFYNDGLLRLSTEKYADPQKCESDTLYMHLTNYSVNKRSENYAKGDDDSTGSKRSIRFLNEYLQKRDYDVPLMWRNIIDLLVKTIIAVQPHLLQHYRMCRPASPPGSDSVCFEILGFDVLLDHKLKPWLVEVNRSPSFGAEQPIDRRVKLGVLDEALRLLNIRASDRARHANAQKVQSQRRLMRGRSNGAENQHQHQHLQQLQRERELVRRREELQAQLARLRREADRDEHEIRTCRLFRRIFPGDDRVSQERYVKLMLAVFGALTPGRGAGSGAGTLKELEEQYSCERPRQEELMDQLARCEEQLQQHQQPPSADASGKLQNGRQHQNHRRPWQRHHPPQSVQRRQSSLTLSADEVDDSADDDSFDDDYNDAVESGDRQTEAKLEAEGADDASGRLPSVSSTPTLTTSTSTTTPRRRHTVVAASGAGRSRGVQADRSGGIGTGDQQEAEQLCRRMLDQLNELCIRFPGKSAQQAEQVLAGLHQNWRQNKALVAGYWLAKLDADKRRKVIDIVRQNVRATLSRCWRSGADLDESRICRLFDRVFARLLSSNGQGLWATFGNSASWESALLRMREPPSLPELACCRRVVQLCQDCLLTVFLFSGQSAAPSADVGASPSTLSRDSGSQLKRERPSLSVGFTYRASLG
ncbi:hypothetical protein BOX15_Mlig025648g3 [Macrostomum lignano]|uniref:Tubulin polyglutamylase TTLL7 n=1 Tax=Macrostomum lignano TaxID=282301 RepID=A0A267G8N1_9PLAT|nr:hypothetical protein BOX15_Mlig025648g3 [Macrostomum lignano]